MRVTFKSKKAKESLKRTAGEIRAEKEGEKLERIAKSLENIENGIEAILWHLKNTI